MDNVERFIQQTAGRYLEPSDESFGYVLSTHNRPLRSFADIYKYAKTLMTMQEFSFKFQVALGFVLREISTGTLSFFYASENTGMFPKPPLIKNRYGMRKILDHLKNFDYELYFKFPKSGMTVEKVIYARYYIYQLSRPLGCLGCNLHYSEIPQQIISNKFIKNIQTWQSSVQCDNTCVFKCVAFHLWKTRPKKPGRTLARITKDLFNQYCEIKRIRAKQFPGIKPEDFHLLEDTAKVSIYLYIIEIDKKTPKGLLATCIRAPEVSNEDTVYLLQYNSHVFYCKDIFRATGYMVCNFCDKHFTSQKGNFNKHMKQCAKAQNKMNNTLEFVQSSRYREAAYYQPRMDVFEEICKYTSREISLVERKTSFLCVFDAECLFINNEQKRGKHTTTLSTMEPYSIGVTSNVPGFTDTVIFYADLLPENQNLGTAFVEYILKISEKQKEILSEHFKELIEFLTERIEIAEHNNSRFGKKIFPNLKRKLNNFVSRLPVLGYNTAKFDFKLMRHLIMPALYEHFGSKIQILITQGSYNRIQCESFIFLDMLNFVSNRTSYDKFVFNVLGKRLKGVFPYSHLQSLAQLDQETSLPPIEAWYSSLKECNLLAKDYDMFKSMISEGFSKTEALEALNLTEEPKNAEDMLNQLKLEWKNRGFKTLRNYASWYLERDLEPLLECAVKQSNLYFQEYGINIFRDHVGLPSIAVRIAMRYFEDYPVFVPSKYAYELLNKHMVGGLSLLFCLEGIKDVTRINYEKYGEDSLTMKSVFSLDASLMYGKAMSQNMPFGIEYHRKRENNFRREFGHKKFEKGWLSGLILAYKSWEMGIHIQSNLIGSERELTTSHRKFRPDGVAKIDGELVAFEVQGFGGVHWCPVCSPTDLNEKHPISKESYAEIKEREAKRKAVLLQEFADVVYIYDCEFRRDYMSSSGKFHHEYCEFLSIRKDYDMNKTVMTEKEIIESIKNGKLTGFVLGDWSTPDKLKEKCEIFPLFFKRVNVSIEDLSPIQQEYLCKQDLLRKPKLELITSHFAKEILISCELASFYLNLGAVLSNVQVVLEWKTTNCLEPYVNKACEMRCHAHDMESRLLGENAKALVVSTFGKFIRSPKKDVLASLDNEETTVRKVNNPNFYSCDYVGSNDSEDLLFLNTVKPKNLNFNAVPHLGNHVLCGGKLQILKFIYEAIEPNMDKRTYQLFSHQTDSISFMCSEASFEDWIENCVLEDRKEIFKNEIMPKWFPLQGKSEEARRSKFTPGIFKKEFEGEVCCAISPKVYIVEKNQKIVKQAMRGIPDHKAKQLKADDFLNVLQNHEPVSVELENFKYLHGEYLNEKMKKIALRCNYIKRYLLPSMNTKVLDL